MNFQKINFSTQNILLQRNASNNLVDDSNSTAQLVFLILIAVFLFLIFVAIITVIFTQYYFKRKDNHNVSVLNNTDSTISGHNQTITTYISQDFFQRLNKFIEFDKDSTFVEMLEILLLTHEKLNFVNFQRKQFEQHQ